MSLSLPVVRASVPFGWPIVLKDSLLLLVSELGKGTVRWLPRGGGVGVCPIPRKAGMGFKLEIEPMGLRTVLPEAWERCLGKCPLPQLLCWELTSKPQGAGGALGTSSGLVCVWGDGACY